MALLLTLGHNSSAILVRDGKIVCGYENERITGRKSDSAFPIDALRLISSKYEIEDDVDIFISHWFTDPDLSGIENKWYSQMLLKSLYPKCTINSLSQDFTHHDAHAYSALLFAGSEFANSDGHVLVADGFGSYGEVLSIYKVNGGECKVIDRCFGFNVSLGLMYQYATSYLGMKMHQDEYKLLGYEWYDCKLDTDVSKAGNKILSSMFNKVVRQYDPNVSIEALPETMAMWYAIFDSLTNKHKVTKNTKAHKQLVATFVQRVLEFVITSIIRHYNMQNLAVAGGVFMNVKLNNAISRAVENLHIMPLCGDSGAALGLYYHSNNIEWPGNLFWGDRDLSGFFSGMLRDTRLHVLSRKEAVNYISSEINLDRIVNIVQGSVEYGPRALGHTSTIALPNTKNVIYINSCNHRSTIMPMAGFCRDIDAHKFHNQEDLLKTNYASKYMICTFDMPNPSENIIGAAHFDNERSVFTGRTQVVTREHDSVFFDVLSNTKAKLLINTSFNPHGTPIPCSESQVLAAHMYMISNDPENRVSTVIIKEE